MSSSSSSSNSRLSSSRSLPQINGRGLIESRESPSGVSQAQSSSSRLQTSDGPKMTLVARPSTSVGFQKATELSSRHSRPASPARPWMQEVAEQLRSLKADMEQKDSTISKLRSDNSQLQARIRSEQDSHTVQSLCSQILQHLDGSSLSGVASDHLPQLAIERSAALAEERKQLSRQVSDLRTRAEEASSELAAERVHTSSQQNGLKQTKDMLSERQEQVEQLRGEVERLQQNSARQTSLVQSLRQQVQELENERSHYSSERLKCDTTISALRQEIESQKRHVAEMQEQLDMQSETVKANEQKAAKIGERYETLCSGLGELLEVEGAGLMTSLDDMLISKATAILQENDELHSQLSSLKSSLEACDMDARAGRETIMRLVSEVGKEQKTASSHQGETRKLQLERETSEQRNAQSLHEIETLKGQMSATQSAWTDAKTEIQTKDARIASLDAQLHASQQQREELHAKIEAFSGQLSRLLTSGFEACDSESAILGKVQEVTTAHRNTESLVQTLEHQVTLLKQQVGEHEHLSARATEQAHHLESQLKEKDEQMQALEKEILAVDAIKDDLKKDKEKHSEFCDQLCETLDIGQLTTSLGLEVNSEVIIARVHQLVKQEGDALTEKTVALSSLQRKMKSVRKDIESRDLHITLLQRKIASHEEKLAQYYKRETEEASAVDKAKKLQKQLDRAVRHIEEQKAAMRELKAQLHDVDEYRTQGVEYLHKIRQCEHTIEELASAKGRLTKQLASTQKRLETKDSEMKESDDHKHQVLQRMQEELGMKERELAEAREREQQLVQFRHALGQVLGLDVSSTTIPDYDIVSRVEKVVAAEKAHMLTSQTLEANLRQLGSNFQSSYDSAMGILSPQRAQQAAESTILANIRHLPSDFAMKPV